MSCWKWKIKKYYLKTQLIWPYCRVALMWWSQNLTPVMILRTFSERLCEVHFSTLTASRKRDCVLVAYCFVYFQSPDLKFRLVFFALTICGRYTLSQLFIDQFGRNCMQFWLYPRLTINQKFFQIRPKTSQETECLTQLLRSEIINLNLTSGLCIFCIRGVTIPFFAGSGSGIRSKRARIRITWIWIHTQIRIHLWIWIQLKCKMKTNLSSLCLNHTDLILN